MKLIGVDAEFPALLDLRQVALEIRFAGCEVTGQPFPHPADERMDGQAGNLAGDVPQAIVEVAEPARLVMEPAGPLVEHLKQALPGQRVLTDDLVGEGICVDGRHVGRAATGNALVRLHVDEMLTRPRIDLAATAASVLNAP